MLLEFAPERRFVFTDAFTPGWQPHEPFMVGAFEIEPDGDGTLYRGTARHWSAEAMEKHTDEVFARTAERLASKARQRRKPSA